MNNLIQTYNMLLFNEITNKALLKDSLFLGKYALQIALF